MPAYIELHMQAYVLAIVKYLNMFSALFIFSINGSFVKCVNSFYASETDCQYFLFYLFRDILPSDQQEISSFANETDNVSSWQSVVRNQFSPSNTCYDDLSNNGEPFHLVPTSNSDEIVSLEFARLLFYHL